MVKLIKPASTPEPANPASKGSTARFIADGDSRPTTRKAQPSNFRLPLEIINMLEEESEATGQSKTTVLKAAILAYHSQLSENEKNRWLLESARY